MDSKYLSTLSKTFDLLIGMMDNFSEKQLQILIPQLDYINEVLNAEFNE